MTPANANLLQRLLTAAVAIPLMLLLIFKVPPIGFFVLVVIAVAAAGRELFRMTHPDDSLSQLVLTLVTVGLSLTEYFFGDDLRTWMAITLVTPLFGLLMPLWRLGDIKTAAFRAAAGAFGPLYCSLITPVALLLKERGSEGPGYVILVLAISWMADTFGYFAGRFLGSHKLYEAVSPKKTIEGAIGGLVGSVLSAIVVKILLIPTLPMEHVVPLALVAGAIGQMGDLGESMIKRSIGIKDSGGIVPGHGGILDRVDATVVAAVATYLYTRWYHG